MAFDLESMLGGGGSGIVTAVFTLLGWSKKIESKVNQEACDKTHDAIQEQFKAQKELMNAHFDSQNRRLDCCEICHRC